MVMLPCTQHLIVFPAAFDAVLNFTSLEAFREMALGGRYVNCGSYSQRSDSSPAYSVSML